jgi:hypothetical protein
MGFKGKDTFSICRVDQNAHVPGVGVQSGKENGRILVRGPKNGLSQEIMFNTLRCASGGLVLYIALGARKRSNEAL